LEGEGRAETEAESKDKAETSVVLDLRKSDEEGIVERATRECAGMNDDDGQHGRGRGEGYSYLL